MKATGVETPSMSVCLCVCVPTEFVIHSLCSSDAQVMFLLKPAPTQYVCVCVWETAREKMYVHALLDSYMIIMALYEDMSHHLTALSIKSNSFLTHFDEKRTLFLCIIPTLLSPVLQHRPPGLLRPSVRPLSFTNNAHGSLHKTCPCSRKWDHHARRVLPGSSRRTQPYTSPSAHSSMASAPCLICQI